MTPDEVQRDQRVWSRILWEAGHRRRNQADLGRWIRDRYPTAGLSSQGAQGLAGRALHATEAGFAITGTAPGTVIQQQRQGYVPSLPAGTRHRVRGRVVLSREGAEAEKSVLFVFDFAHNPSIEEIERRAADRVREARGEEDKYRGKYGLSGYGIDRTEVHAIEKRRY